MFASQRRELWREPNNLVFERKFDTALRESQIINFLDRFHSNTLTYDDKLLVQSKWFDPDIQIEYSPDCYARVLSQILSNSSNPEMHRRHSASVYNQAMQLTVENVRLQSGYMTQSNYLPIIANYNDKLDDLLKTLPSDTRVAYLTKINNLLTEMVEMTPSVNAKLGKSMSEQEKIDTLTKTNHYEIEELGLRLSWSRNLCCVRIGTHQFVLPQPYLLLMQNKLCDLISVLVLTESTKTSSNPQDATEITIEFVMLLINLIIQYKNDFFTISKDIEAFGTAETLIECEEWINDEFLKVLNKDIYNKIGFQYVGSELQALLKRCDIPFRHEIMCLSKIMGHPLVDMKGGTEALYKNTTESYEIDYYRVNEATCFIKENYIRNHIAKTGRWPPSDVLYGAHPCLLQAQLRNKDPNHPDMVRRYGQVDIIDYTKVELRANATFQKLENVIPYLKDRTISILRSQVFNSYLQGKKPQNSWKETRLLLFYLMKPECETDHVEFINQYVQSETLEELMDYLVIRVVPKEKEHKVSYRGFGCLEFHNRMRCLAQEKTAMKFLDMYSDEQAMSLSELGILLRLDTFRRMKTAYAKHHILYVTVDSTAWNNHFRSQTTDVPMAETMDKIHGTSIFGKTQLAYEKTLVYVPDEKVVYSWDGQSGGIEGQNQETWVITFLGHMKTALKDLNIKYHIFCKGDDFRVALCIPVSQVAKEELREYKNRVVRALAGIAAELGHKIKIDECYGSEIYLSFSKCASCGLVELPQAFRKIMKCYGANNAFLPTLDEYIASAFSNAHSACKVSSNVLGNYVVALFWAYNWLLQHKKFKNLSSDELVALLLTPSVVGGFPIIYLHNMYVRAEYDLLSPFIDILRYVTRVKPTIAVYMRNFCCVIPGLKTDYRKLFRDQASIPTSQPPLPTAVLRQSIITPLRRIVKNSHMQELFDSADSEVNDAIIECLNSAEVMSVRVMANLYAASPEGLVMKFIRKFEAARSIYEVLIINRGYRSAIYILRKVIKAENLLQHWRVLRLQHGPQGDETSFLHLIGQCPAEAAQKVREWGWGKKIEGITMPPMVHQTYITTELQSGHDQWARNNHFSFKISDTVSNYSRDQRHHFAVGSYAPFFGHITKAGVTYPTVELEEKEDVLLAVQNLIDLASWVDKSEVQNGVLKTSNVVDFIDKLVKMYTQKSYMEMAPHASKRKSGTIQHHMRSPTFREAIMPNMLSNRTTFIQGESNSHRLFRETGSHYHMNFLHCYCYCMHQLTIELEVDRHINTPMTAWGVTTSCTYCNQPIKESPIVLNLHRIKGLAINPLSETIVGRTSIKVLHRDLLKAKNKKLYVPPSDETLSVFDATMGIVSEIYHYHNVRVASLETRYTQHHSTAESISVLERFLPSTMKKLVSLTEMKKVRVRDILSALLKFIVFNLYKMFGTMSDNEIKMSMRLVPYMDLPWYQIVDMVYEVGRLGELMYELSTISGEPLSASCYSPKEAVYTIGQTAVDLKEDVTQIQSIILLSDYEENVLWSIAEPQLESNKRILICQFYGDRVENITPIDGMAVMLAHWEPDADEYSQALLSSGLQGEALLLECDEHEMPLDYFLSPQALDKTTITLSWLKNKIGKARVKAGFEYIKGHYDETLTAVNDQLRSNRIEIVVTTISDCINVIRAQDFKNVSQTISEKLSAVGQALILKPPIDDDEVVQYKVPKEHTSLLDYQPQTKRRYTISEILLNRGHLSRKFGFSTRSTTTLIEILEIFGMSPSTFPKCPVVCALGEGRGSMTALIGALTNNAVCVYMTKAQDERVETLPELAVWGTRMTIHYNHIMSGVQDVSNTNHLEYLENTYGYLYNLVLSDVEPGPATSPTAATYVTAIYNVVSFYLRNRTEEGVLIMQYYINESTDLHDLLLYVGRFIEHVYVVHTKSIGCHRAIYIVGWGVRRLKSKSWDIVRDPPSEASSRCVTRVIRMTEKSVNSRLENPDINLMDTPLFKYKWDAFAPALFINLMERYIGVSIPYSSYSMRGTDAVDMVRLIKSINLNCGTFGLFRIVDILNRGGTEMRVQSWDNDTRAHRLILLNRYFAIQGFLFINDLCVLGEYFISAERIKKHFVDLVEHLDPRDRTPGDTTHFWRGYDVNNQKIEFYLYYTRGIFTFLSMYAYFAQVHKKIFRVYDTKYLETGEI